MKTPAQITATLARTKDPNKAHSLYRALLQSLATGQNVLPWIVTKTKR